MYFIKNTKFELTEGEIQTIVSKVDDSISTWKSYHKNFKREKTPVVISLEKEPLDTENSLFVFGGSGKFGKVQDLWLSDKGEYYFKVDDKVQRFWNAYHITNKKFSTKAFVWGLLDYYEGGQIGA